MMAAGKELSEEASAAFKTAAKPKPATKPAK
jgi:hypothetical protein